jgi:hypothetical protein
LLAVPDLALAIPVLGAAWFDLAWLELESLCVRERESDPAALLFF